MAASRSFWLRQMPLMRASPLNRTGRVLCADRAGSASAALDWMHLENRRQPVHARIGLMQLSTFTPG